MRFGFFLIELKSTAEFPRNLVFFNLQKKFTETTDLANNCADLFMQSLATRAFSPLTPIQTETELIQNVMQSAQLSSSHTRQSLCPSLMLH